jgi:hypothetical protein
MKCTKQWPQNTAWSIRLLQCCILVLCTTPSYIVHTNTHNKDFILLDQIGQDLDVFESMTAHTTKTLKKLKKKICHHNFFI